MNAQLERIKNLEKTNQQNKLEEAKLQEQLKINVEEQTKILEQLKALNVNVGELEGEVEILNNQNNAEIVKIEEILK